MPHRHANLVGGVIRGDVSEARTALPVRLVVPRALGIRGGYGARKAGEIDARASRASLKMGLRGLGILALHLARLLDVEIHQVLYGVAQILHRRAVRAVDSLV